MNRYELAYKCEQRTVYRDELASIATIEVMKGGRYLPFTAHNFTFDSVQEAVINENFQAGTYALMVCWQRYSRGYELVIGEQEFHLKMTYDEEMNDEG